MRTVWVSSMTSRLPQYGTNVLGSEGTIYPGDQPVPRAVDAVKALRRRGSEALFLTNYPLRSGAECAQFPTSLGVPPEPAAVVTPIDRWSARMAFLNQRTARKVVACERVHSDAYAA